MASLAHKLAGLKCPFHVKVSLGTGQPIRAAQMPGKIRGRFVRSWGSQVNAKSANSGISHILPRLDRRMIHLWSRAVTFR